MSHFLTRNAASAPFTLSWQYKINSEGGICLTPRASLVLQRGEEDGRRISARLLAQVAPRGKDSGTTIAPRAVLGPAALLPNPETQLRALSVSC